MYPIIMDKVDLSSPALLNPLLYQGMVPGASEARPGIAAKMRGSPLGAKKARAKGDLRLNRKTIFSEILENSVSAGELGPVRELDQSEEALTELMDQVHSSGSDLIDRPFHDEILRYKRAVRDFINYVVTYGYELHKIQGVKRKIASKGETEWKTAVYCQIQVVDTKLEELAAAILSGQTTQLERVSRMNEITGLLVDLTVTGAIRERDE